MMGHIVGYKWDTSWSITAMNVMKIGFLIMEIQGCPQKMDDKL
jgi:hypothetical protein